MGAKMSGGGSRFDLGQNADINVTPFVDVMLVLLIIFMVAAPLATVSIKLDLPPPSDTPPAEKKEPVLINVQANGLYIGGEETTTATLIADLTKALASPNPQEETVLIRADRYIKYSQFMDVLNTLQYAGFLKIALIAEDL